jgi:hypothetical protein
LRSPIQFVAAPGVHPAKARRIAVNIARLPGVYPQVGGLRRLGVTGGRDMPQRLNWKAVANESKYPYIVELLVVDDKLDVEVTFAGPLPARMPDH